MTKSIIEVPAKKDEYRQLQLDYIRDFVGMLADGQTITADDIVAGLKPNEDNTLIRDWAQKNAKVSKTDFEKALRKVRIKDELGAIPQSATHLLRLIVARDKIKARMNGILDQDPLPYLTNEHGKRTVISKEDREDEEVERMVKTYFPPTITVPDLERRLRVISDELKLQMRAPDISDAVTDWLESSKRERLWEIKESLGTKPLGEFRMAEANAAWTKIVEGLFDLTDTSPEFVIAVLKKFMWQVKRKMNHIPVTDHLMPVIQGPQGTGKTTFVKTLIEPLSDLSAEVDFGMVQDDRNVDLWKNLILFFDEMGWATKADADRIKNLITASTLTRRPMRTNSAVVVNQDATFIGCSNKTLDQLIKDPTGIRRFVEIVFRNDPDWTVLDDVDVHRLWQSVDARGADPMVPYRAELQAKQEASREAGPVEMWLEQFDPHKRSCKSGDGYTFASLAQGNAILATDLFVIFTEWLEVTFPGFRMNLNQWGQEMSRLRRQGDGVVFEPKRTKAARMYVYTGKKPVMTVIQPKGDGV